ncbi:MAG: hypothetical protein J4F28_02020 [Nitrosopumilaceae archaeon]|nr:hypothetical protein [Nitrosopumilaceae archaeon]
MSCETSGCPTPNCLGLAMGGSGASECEGCGGVKKSCTDCDMVLYDCGCADDGERGKWGHWHEGTFVVGLPKEGED